MWDRGNCEALAERQFPHAVRSIRDARTWTKNVLSSWGLATSIDSALLVVSELLTNAVVHGHPPLNVRLCRQEEWLHIEVTDGGTAVTRAAELPDVTPEISGLSEDSLRLQVVQSLAAVWGLSLTDAGKGVWASLALATTNTLAGSSNAQHSA